MSDEIKAAAERYRTQNYNFAPMAASCQLLRNDAELLTRAYIADLAAREAEQAERARGIDEEWLLSIGFTKQISDGATFILISSRWHEVEIIGGCVYLAPKNGTFIRVGTALTTTRGMMLDFLSSLKIPTKQQQ